MADKADTRKRRRRSVGTDTCARPGNYPESPFMRVATRARKVRGAEGIGLISASVGACAPQDMSCMY